MDHSNPYAYGGGEHTEPPEYSEIQPRTSGLAVASLICSLFVCCPIVTLIGPLLGLSAIVSISAHPAERRGKGLAVAGIVIGILTTGAWGGMLWWGANLVRSMMEFATADVPAAIEAGYDGKMQEFRAVLTPTVNNSATDTQIQQFLDDLQARYGAFIDLRLPDDISFEGDSFVVTVPVVFEFENNSAVDGELLLRMDSYWGDHGWKLESLTITDPAQGDVRFP